MKKIQIVLGAATVLCLVSILVSSLVIGSMAGRLECQNAVSRWASDGTLTAQLSAFLSRDAEVSRLSFERSFPSALDSALIEASISLPNENARLYAHAYSAETTASLTVINEYGKTVGSALSAAVTACGGDYFIFHPLVMLSGHYFSTTDILNDCVVIDNDIAWQFFGSHDVVGRSIRINGRDCYISGVCQNGRAGNYSEFYGDKPRIFVSYSFAEEVVGELPVTLVEVLLPDPVGGFAMDMFKDALSVPDEDCEYVENSSRFSDESLGALLSDYTERSVRTNTVTFPYFENTARKLCDTAALVYIFKIVPVYMLGIITVTEVIILYVNRRRIFEAAKAKLKRVRRT